MSGDQKFQAQEGIRLLNVREAARLLGTTPASLYSMVWRREVPFVKLGRALRFDLIDLEAFIEASKFKPDGEFREAIINMGVFKRYGQYYIDYYFRGRRQREKVGPSKSEAIQALSVRQAEIAQGKFKLLPKRGSPRFEAVSLKYLALVSIHKRGRKGGTVHHKNVERFFRKNQGAQFECGRRREIQGRAFTSGTAGDDQ